MSPTVSTPDNMVNIPALKDITLPKHVRIIKVPDLEKLFTNIGRRSVTGYSGYSFFGCAFIQGGRLQFSTAMPIDQMLKVSRVDRSNKKDVIDDVLGHSNRPAEPAHSRDLRKYLVTTACQGEKFILPAFTFNYGVGLTDDAPRAIIEVLSFSDDDGQTSWPAILQLPNGAQLDTTDGAHRRSQIEAILDSPDKKVSEQEKHALTSNAVDVKIVFEAGRADSHQDFADCGKAKAIPASMVATFDVRDKRNLMARELVRASDFLRRFVDTTASNVNLSRASSMIWSMSAVRNFVSFALEALNVNSDQPVSWLVDEFCQFFDELVAHLPQLKLLDAGTQSAGSLRETRGGNVALRGVGMAIFARAFVYAHEDRARYGDMARALARIDWNLLRIERDELQIEGTFTDAVYKNANGMWVDLLAVSEGGFRIRSSGTNVDEAWTKMLKEIEPLLAARKAA